MITPLFTFMVLFAFLFACAGESEAAWMFLLFAVLAYFA
jgi:hypothetical protein